MQLTFSCCVPVGIRLALVFSVSMYAGISANSKTRQQQPLCALSVVVFECDMLLDTKLCHSCMFAMFLTF